MSELSEGRRVRTAVLLIGGVAISCLASWRLDRLGHLPESPAPYFLAFGVTLLLSLLAGSTVRAGPGRERSLEPRRPIGRRRRAALWIAGCVAALLFASSLTLHAPQSHPLKILTFWAASLVAGAAASALLSPTTAEVSATVRRGRAGAWWALGLVLLAAASVRLIALDESPPIFSGDEVSPVMDALSLIRGESRTDPFGTGWSLAMRLGLLPAGWGTRLSLDPIVGPRLPYAVAGVLSIVAAAMVAGLLAGRWGALACAGFLAFAPFHLHFSRIANHVILDSLSVCLTLFFLITAFRTASPLFGFLAGATGGLALYGYSGGKVAAATLLLILPFAAFGSRAGRPKRGLMLFCLGIGFAMAAAPNLRFALQHPADWAGRMSQVGISEANWWTDQVVRFGSPAKVLEHQFVAGTLGFLSLRATSPTFHGYSNWPLPGLAIAGLGWLVGRRQFFTASLLATVIAGNLAGIILTIEAPTPQRSSSLVPALAILGGVAVAAFLSLLPRQDRRGIPWKASVGALIIGGWLVGTFGGPPGVWDPSPDFGGGHAAFVRSAWQLLRAPRYRGESVLLHGQPFMDSTFPGFDYFLPQIRWRDVATREGDPEPPAPGWHLFSPEWVRTGVEWKTRWNLRGIALPETGYPLRDTGYLLFAPERHRN